MMPEPPPSVLFIHPNPGARDIRVAAVRQLGFLAGAVARAGEVGALNNRGLNPDVIVFDDAADDMSPAQFAEELLRRLGDAAPPVVYVLTSQHGEPSIPSPPLRPGVDVVLQRPVRARDALRALMCCVQRSAGAGTVLHAGELDFDVVRRVLSFQGRSVELTRFESLLLEYLMRRAGRPVPIEELLERVWGFEPGTGSPEVVRAHVRNLRNKLQTIGASRELVVNLPGRGYMLDVPTDVPASLSTTP